MDWYRNVRAAGRCTWVWHNEEYAIEKIKPLDTETGLAMLLAAFPFPFSPILRLRGQKDFARMEHQTG